MVIVCRVVDVMWDDGNDLGLLDIYNYFICVMYNCCNKFDFLWNILIFGGVKNGVKYLGSVSEIKCKFLSIYDCFSIIFYFVIMEDII